MRYFKSHHNLLFFSTFVLLQNPAYCFEWKIIGGKKTDIRDVPYQLQVLRNGKHLCGATLISETRAVSASHCYVHSTMMTVYEVVAGSTERYDHIYTVSDKPLIPVKVLVHEDFCAMFCEGDQIEFNNDVALLTLETPLEFSDSIRPAKLPELNQPVPVGKKALVSGYGVTGTGIHDNPSPVLMSVEVEIIPLDECKRLYKKEYITITENMLCAGKVVNEDACQGDSGGPLVIDGVLIGIVSFGVGCGEKDHPGVYTNVANYVDMILYDKL